MLSYTRHFGFLEIIHIYKIHQTFENGFKTIRFAIKRIKVQHLNSPFGVGNKSSTMCSYMVYT